MKIATSLIPVMTGKKITRKSRFIVKVLKRHLSLFNILIIKRTT